MGRDVNKLIARAQKLQDKLDSYQVSLGLVLQELYDLLEELKDKLDG